MVVRSNGGLYIKKKADEAYAFQFLALLLPHFNVKE